MEFIAKDEFIKVIKHSQNIVAKESDFNIDTLYTRWAQNKEWFYHCFGDKYIYEVPEEVTFTLGDKQKQQKYDSFIGSVENYFNNKSLGEFLRCCTANEFFNNQLESNVVWEINENEEPLKLQKGMKLLKCFKFFETNKNVLVDIQNEASRIIQENKITGKLCFSIHPLDYLSVSENAFNWRSCHALDGDFRAGNLSYMCDNSTVVCYLRADGTDWHLPNFPSDVTWNSKKWRVLLFFSSDHTMMFIGRPYPFALAEGTSVIKDWCDTIFAGANNYWGMWCNKQLTVDSTEVTWSQSDLIPLGKGFLSLKHLIQEVRPALPFNDLIMSTCYRPSWSYLYSKDVSAPEHFNTGYTKIGKTRLHVGAHTPCPLCGERYLENHDVMVCDKCFQWIDNDDDDSYICGCCDCRIPSDDVHVVEGDYLCRNCFERQTTQCQVCGTWVYNDHITYSERQQKYICMWCKNEQEVTENNGERTDSEERRDG